MSHMVHVITLGFSPARVIRRGMERFYATHDPKLLIRHYLVDQHYPLRREENLAEMHRIVKDFGLSFLDSGKDRGLHNGLNWTLEQIKPNLGDIVIMYDPDGGPTHKKWDGALNYVIKEGGYSIACLVDPRAGIELIEKGCNERRVGPVMVFEPKTNTVFSIVAWDWAFMKAMLPLDEENPYYGGLESYMWGHLQRLKLKWAYLPQFNEENGGREMTDPEYTAWKWMHAHHKNFPGSFAEYLAAGCPGIQEVIGPP